MALVRSDPFRDVDRLFQQVAGGLSAGARALAMPMDAHRQGDSFLIQLDLPGVAADTIDLTVEDNVLTVKAERPAPPRTEEMETIVSERPFGTFTRQVLLGNNLDTEHIEAHYRSGVLSLMIPVAAHAKPRRIPVNEQADHQVLST